MAPSAELEQRIVATSLTAGVLCRFTAYVATEDSITNPGGERRTVVQPVEAPARWAMFDSARKMSAMAAPPPPGTARSSAPKLRRMPAPMLDMDVTEAPLDLSAYGHRASALIDLPLAELVERLAELVEDLRSVGAQVEALETLLDLLRSAPPADLRSAVAEALMQAGLLERTSFWR